MCIKQNEHSKKILITLCFQWKSDLMENCMGMFKKEKHLKIRVFVILAMASILSLILFQTLGLDMDVSAQENQVAKEEVSNGKILNLFGKEMGAVDTEGNITNISGTFLGAVDSSGTILNVSKIVIGKVAADGKVSNQSGTELGSVNAAGEIFNVSGRKIGEVKGENDINKTGGAARLIFFKK